MCMLCIHVFIYVYIHPHAYVNICNIYIFAEDFPTYWNKNTFWNSISLAAQRCNNYWMKTFLTSKRLSISKEKVLVSWVKTVYISIISPKGGGKNHTHTQKYFKFIENVFTGEKCDPWAAEIAVGRAPCTQLTPVNCPQDSFFHQASKLCGGYPAILRYEGFWHAAWKMRNYFWRAWFRKPTDLLLYM